MTDESSEDATVRRWGVAEDGAVIELVLSPDLLHELARRWPPRSLELHTEPPDGWTGRPDAHLGFTASGLTVPVAGTPLSDSPDQTAWNLMEQTITIFAVQRLTHLVAVHAAVVAQEGSAVLIPGVSGAGKSTLAMAAHEIGATVLTDEYALIDPVDGMTTGWVRPVRLRGDAGTETRVDVAVNADPMPVGIVAALAYGPGPADWVPVPAAEAVMIMLSQTICARTRPDASLDAALAVCRRATTLAGTRGDAAETASVLLSMLADQRNGSSKAQ